MATNRVIDPADFLASAEELWRPRLESAGLVIEVLPPSEQTHKAARAFGLLYRGDVGRGYRALHKHPAALAMALTGVATSVYEGGTFWPGFWATCDYEGSQTDQVDWGEAFLKALRALGLPDFPGLPKRYLGPLLLHAGIPTYCLQDYFHVLDVGIRRVGADAASLVQWVLPRLDTTFPNVDVPVRRFIQYGGEYAVDFIDQSIDALLVLAEDPDGIVTAQIPERVVDAARSFLEQDRSRGRAIRNGGTRAKPRITVALDPYAGEVQLRLPALDSFDTQVVWQVIADGETDHVRPPVASGGRSASILASSWRINRPVRAVSVSANGLKDAFDLAIVHEADPFLCFQESGELLPAHMALPPEPVWVLYALPRGEAVPAFADRILREELPPLGWSGWALALVDLAGLHDVRLTDRSPAHPVRTQSRASVTTGEEVGWLTMQRLPVQAQRPTLHLPDNITARWRLQVFDLDAGLEVSSAFVESHAEYHDAIDPFDGLAAPVLGRFRISLKGPFGRGVQRDIAMAEGLRVNPAQPWRSLSRNGLAELRVTLGAEGLAVEPEALEFARDQVQRHITLRSDRTVVDAEASPPAMAVATIRAGLATRWVHGACRVHLEDSGSTELLVRIRPGSPPPDLEVMEGERRIQSISAGGRGTSGYASYALSSLADTLRAHPVCDLFVRVDSESIRIGRIEPKRIAVGATATDDALSLTGFTGGAVEVRAWSLAAPWIPAASLWVDEVGACPIPSELRGLGSLVVSWKRSDPWVPNDWEWMPAAGESTVVRIDADTAALPAGAAGLLGLEPASPLSEVRQAWALLALASRFPGEYSWDSVRTAIAVLREHPTSAMLALAEVPSSASHRLTLLIRSGALWSTGRAATEFGHAEPSETDALTVAAPAWNSIALLRAEHVIGPLLVLPWVVAAAPSGEVEEVWRTLKEVYGAELVSVLRGLGDPAVRGGSFAVAKWLAEQDDDEQARIIAGLRLVPRAVLDLDSRSRGAVELFQRRHETALVAAGRDGRERLKTQAAILRDQHWDAALALLQARAGADDRGGWLSLSAQSAGFALLARLAARGDDHAQMHMDAHMRHWLALAEAAPTLVTADVVLAEAMALAAFSAPTTFSFADEDGERPE